MKPKIFIGGDSWGCGEWSADKSGISHKGIEQYLIDDGYIVINSATGASSNKNSITRLSLSVQNYTDGDIILWIQTDPVRDLQEHGVYADNIANAFADSFIQFQKELLLSSYRRLDDIAVFHNTTIFVIGGCQNINYAELIKFKNLNMLVKSWVHLLVNETDEDNFGFGAPNWHINDFQINKLSKDIRIQLINDIHQYRKVILRNYAIFNPDGAHPNRDGHKILYNFIKEKLNL